MAQIEGKEQYQWSLEDLLGMPKNAKGEYRMLHPQDGQEGDYYLSQIAEIRNNLKEVPCRTDMPHGVELRKRAIPRIKQIFRLSSRSI